MLARWIIVVIGSALFYGGAFVFFLTASVMAYGRFADDGAHMPLDVDSASVVLAVALVFVVVGFVIRKGYPWAHRTLEYGLLGIALWLYAWPFYSCYSDPWTCHYGTMLWQLYPGVVVLLLANALRNTRQVLRTSKPKSHRLSVAFVLVCMVFLAPIYLQRWAFKMVCNEPIVGWDDRYHYQYVGDERVNTYVQLLKVAAQIIELEQDPYSGPLNILNGEYAAFLVPPGGFDSVVFTLDEENRGFSFGVGSMKESTHLFFTRNENLKTLLTGYDYSIEALDCSAGTAAMADMSKNIASRAYLMTPAVKAWRTTDRKFWMFSHRTPNTKLESTAFSIVRHASGSSFSKIHYDVPAASSDDLFNAVARRSALPDANLPSWLSQLERSTMLEEPIDFEALQVELNDHGFTLRDNSGVSNIYSFTKNGIEVEN